MNILHSIKTTTLLAVAILTTGNAWGEVNSQETLNSAITNAAAGGTVTLDGDITLSSAVSISKSLTLDLNGHNITNTSGTAIYVSGSSVAVTIKDAKATAAPTVSGDYNVEYTSGKIEAKYAAVHVYDGASLTIESGTFKSTNNNGISVGNTTTSALSSGSFVMKGGYIESQEYGVGVYISSTATVNGGVIVARDNAAVAGNGASNLQTTEGTTINITGGKIIGKIQSTGYAACGIYHPQSGTVNISGGEIVAVNGPGIVMRAGVLNMTGGTVTATGTTTGWVGDQKVALTCSGVVVDVDSKYSAATTKNIDVDVTGGTVSGTAASIDILNSKNDETNIFNDITVGPSATLVGEINNSNTTGTSDVVILTLQQIINNAATGSTITLAKDYNESITIPTGKTITLDLNGHKITSSSGYTIYNNGTLTVKDSGTNGEIVSTGNTGMAVGNNSTTTIESGNISSVEGAVVTGKSTGAKITINGGTFSASDNAVIAGNGSSREGNANTITINGGTFNGGITSSGYVACGIYAPWKDVITVTGGTFNITGGAGIVARAGTVTVTGGEFNCSGNVTGKVGDSRVVVPCSPIVYDSEAEYPGQAENSQIAITGGAFIANGENVNAVAFVQKEGDTNQRIAISATETTSPSFSSAVAQEYCTNGFVPTQNADGKYGVTHEFVLTDGEAIPLEEGKIINNVKATYTRTMPTDTKWGTVCLPFTLKPSELKESSNITLYTFTSISGSTLTVTEAEGDQTPGTPLLFKCEGAEAVFSTESATVNTSALTEPESGLIGTYTGTTISNTDKLKATYFINGDKFHQAKVSLTVPAYRAYIIYNNSGSAKAATLFITIDDTVTALDATTADLTTLGTVTAYYDTNGTQLNAPLNQGITIVKLTNGNTIKVVK